MAEGDLSSGYEQALLPSEPLPQSKPSPKAPEGELPNKPAPIPASAATVGLFQGGSGNGLNNSIANAANRDVWNLSNVHIHLPHASHTGQTPSLLSQPEQTALFNIFIHSLDIHSFGYTYGCDFGFPTTWNRGHNDALQSPYTTRCSVSPGHAESGDFEICVA
ncbi:hypothetical protein BKA70DRAFT_1447089 [Coprinopsis sp. MPI-PUGE-AT-0042]|nr:hypothetical protein BKA70DRAFT_1447089 [Coprinopsis sp. MPI-PUGE-AT-0042]